MADGDVADRPDPGTTPPQSVRDTDPATLGEALRRAREQRGLTIQQIHATTRIPVRHLEALERDDFHVIPGGMYLRAEIRTYADAVGLNRNVALGYLQPAPAPPPPAVAAPDTAQPSSRRSGVGRTVTVAACVVVAGAIVLWRLDRNARQSRPVPVVADAPAATEPVRTAPVVADAPATAEPVRRSVAPASIEAPPAAAAAPQLAVAPAPPGTTSGTTGSVPVPVSESAVANPDQPPTPSAGGPELEIVSEPAGARVTIDGVGWGVTPLTIRYLPPGNKQLRVTRDGFAAEERVIRFGTGQTRTSVRIQLHQAD